jgi:hypothetical protein
VTKILLLYSNPKGTQPLKLDKEIRHIQDDLEWTQVPDIVFASMGFVKKTDIQRKIASYKPDVVLFSGHGTENGAIVIENEKGNISIVPPTALESVFFNFKEIIKCVILNNCYSREQARAISKHIPFVIGIEGEIDDTASRLFSSKFLQSLIMGNSIKKSFDFAKTEISLIEETYEALPCLHSKNRQNPDDTYLIAKPKILAKFDLAKGKPIINEDDLYQLKISIENAPKDVFAVLYQYMEDEWGLPDQVAECKNKKNQFSDNLAEDGDIEIRAVLWTTEKGIAIHCNVVEALQNYYKGKMSKAEFAAFEKIQANN